MDEVKILPDHGIRYGAPEIDLDKLRAFKDGVVKKLTGGLSGMAKARKVEVVTGVGSFVDPHHLEVVAADGSKEGRQLRQGDHRRRSQAVKLPFMPEDDRVVDSTGALAAEVHPEADARHRRRDHRARDGHRLFDARARASTSSRCSTA